jgi:DNA-binding FadR family transcriptional regulator
LVDGARERAAGQRGLADYFATLIDRGEWVVGVKLPSERELGDRFNTSRGTVRKVIDGFVARGILRRAAGSGTYVIAAPALVPGAAQVAASLAHVSPAELMEARLLFEPRLPGLIVRNATPRDFARMEECLEGGERAVSPADFESWDGRLHKTLAEATHNAFMVTVLELMTNVREAGEWGRLKQRALSVERRVRYAAQHRAIVAALRDRDEERACRLLEAHLHEARKNLFEK